MVDSISTVGSLFAIEGALWHIRSYLRVLERRSLAKKHIRTTMLSLDELLRSTKTLSAAGPELLLQLENLKSNNMTTILNELLQNLLIMFEELRTMFTSILSFAKQCNVLLSKEFQPIMDMVNELSNEVFMIMVFFGANYNKTNNTLEISNLPMLQERLSVNKRWRKRVDSYKDSVNGASAIHEALEKIDKINTRTLKTDNRQLVMKLQRSFMNLERTCRKFLFDHTARKELAMLSPEWLKEATRYIEELRPSIPRG